MEIMDITMFKQNRMTRQISSSACHKKCIEQCHNHWAWCMKPEGDYFEGTVLIKANVVVMGQ
jgi:hypothetical protein